MSNNEKEPAWPRTDFLDWAIDCSFEMDELSILTKEKIKRYKASGPYQKTIRDRPDLAVHAFKSIVEHNLMIRQAKWLAMGLVLYWLWGLIF